MRFDFFSVRVAYARLERIVVKSSLMKILMVLCENENFIIVGYADSGTA